MVGRFPAPSLHIPGSRTLSRISMQKAIWGDRTSAGLFSLPILTIRRRRLLAIARTIRALLPRSSHPLPTTPADSAYREETDSSGQGISILILDSARLHRCLAGSRPSSHWVSNSLTCLTIRISTSPLITWLIPSSGKFLIPLAPQPASTGRSWAPTRHLG